MLLDVMGDKLDISYIDEGEGDVIILLHGWGAKGETYRGIINMLNSHFRVIAPDMPGFGASSEPSFSYTAEDYAEFVRAFAEKLGITKAHLIGHSHGGRTIIKLVTSEKTKLEARKIVLIDSAGLIRKKSFSQKMKILKFKIAKKLFSKVSPDLIEKMRKKNGSADYAAASPIMRKSMVSVINEDLSDSLPEIKSPTLLIWGENDTDTPMYQANKMKDLIPDCGLVTIKGAGHFSFVSDMGLTKRVLHSFFDIK
jgi:pimeloyl-ACP methyl ester carboxylesterase